MQLQLKRTILVGLAFFSISAFWQAYDNIIPLILRDTFLIGDTAAGFIMSLDNISALLLLPVFGAFSDKVGRRMPFIVCGTAAAILFTMGMPFAVTYGRLMPFLVLLGMLLISMSVYRSPAVALMPDVTPKPLRSKGNAIINLMGALGGLVILIVISIAGRAQSGMRADYMPIFFSTAAVMLISVLVLRLTTNEKKLVQDMVDINYGMPIAEHAPAEDTQAQHRAKLPRDVRKSLILILSSVSLWFMGYNAVTTAFTKYATAVWQHDLSQASTCLMIALVGGCVSFIPIGILATKIGRKKMILIGVTMLFLLFALCGLVADAFSPWLYPLFALVGFAWASINVNSYPMVVEISRHGSVGKYTGYYYAFSMAAQIITPTLSGALLEHVGYHTLFPYAAILVAASFCTMFFTKHGDNKPMRPASRLEALDVGD